MRSLRAGLLALVVASFAAAAAAQPQAWARPYAGRWTLAGVSEGDPVCGMTLKPDLAIGGAQIEVSATCRQNFPFEDVAGWRLDGRAIVLIDALRKPLFRFSPQIDGSYGAKLPGGRDVYLERGAPERPASLRVLFDEETFTLSGPDHNAPCGFATSAPSATAGGLEQLGRCSPQWKGKGWARWTATGGKLQLRDRRGGLVLEMVRADEYTFVAEGPGGPWFFGPGFIDGSEVFDR